MKKGDLFEGIVDVIEFPNKGIVTVDGERIVVKNALPGQKIQGVLTKKRKGKSEGRLLTILEPSPVERPGEACEHFGICGGCVYQSLPYEEQLKIKEGQVKALLDPVVKPGSYEFQGIKGSPISDGYRNKMEFSFGDEVKGGPLALGMHKKNTFHDIVNITDCKLVDNDYNLLVSCALNYFSKLGCDFYHKMSHEGYLRHLVIRRSDATGDLLINIVTSSQKDVDMKPLAEEMLRLPLNGSIRGILHTVNDSLADVVKADQMETVYGEDFFYEEILGLKFKISPFSFFQTNSLGAEVLYETAREYVGDTDDKVIFDLYSGTGTIAQMLAPVAKKVVGVEIVEEAVEAARENAGFNGLENCEFIAGDVLKVVDELEDKPDFIVLDPPRDGIHPKAIQKIIDFGVEKMVYISCKPTSLARDLEIFREAGYEVERGGCVDMFPSTPHVETVCLLTRK